MIGSGLEQPLRVYLTGRVSLETADRVIEAPAMPGRQGRLAFVMLAIAPRRLERGQIADVVWGDDPLPDAWDTALAAIISKLRRMLGDLGLDGNRTIQGGDGSYELRLPPGSWVDVRAAINAIDRAEGALRHDDPRGAWADACVASAVFRRSFLPGESGTWVEQWRRDLHEYQVRTFDALSRIWLALGDSGAALQAARRVLDLTPYRESAHVRVMEAHLAAGNRAEAVRVYGDLRTLLEEGMGIAPGSRAEALYEQAIS